MKAKEGKLKKSVKLLEVKEVRKGESRDRGAKKVLEAEEEKDGALVLAFLRLSELRGGNEWREGDERRAAGIRK